MTNTKHRPVQTAIAALAGPLAFATLAVVGPTPAQAHHGEPEIFPAYYEDTVVSFLMGPSGNSQNPHQPKSCFGLGPDMAGTSRRDDVPIMYTLFVPGATQMSCPGNQSTMHDMVLTAVPGDPGYQPAVRVRGCKPGANFASADFPFTSATEVKAGIDAGQLLCGAPGPIRLASVVGRPTSDMAM